MTTYPPSTSTGTANANRCRVAPPSYSVLGLDQRFRQHYTVPNANTDVPPSPGCSSHHRPYQNLPEPRALPTGNPTRPDAEGAAARPCLDMLFCLPRLLRPSCSSDTW
ncbi:hypothetical protein CVT26_010627 [Gymnopilus dilepis]|uniref:Uncharacterized protein n=1 Tax=Gymnopilus dilepis TaxID=231916 RepID=A0A409W566_9AGAR|nr:hypothetical protein CVT26_010627 [Gymnopilus dilepis]